MRISDWSSDVCSSDREDPMHLQGSCRCGAVGFSCDAYAPMPFLRCYCSICRKRASGGGHAVNLGAWADSLEVECERPVVVRSDERRLGKDCVSTCIFRLSPYPLKKHHAKTILD